LRALPLAPLRKPLCRSGQALFRRDAIRRVSGRRGRGSSMARGRWRRRL